MRGSSRRFGTLTPFDGHVLFAQRPDHGELLLQGRPVPEHQRHVVLVLETLETAAVARDGRSSDDIDGQPRDVRRAKRDFGRAQRQQQQRNAEQQTWYHQNNMVTVRCGTVVPATHGRRQ